MGSVPLIDVSGLDGDLAARVTVARQISAACEEIGFFCITGHGVPDWLIEEVRQQSVAFFHHSPEEKVQIARQPPSYRGYIPLASEGLARSLGRVRGSEDAPLPRRRVRGDDPASLGPGGRGHEHQALQALGMDLVNGVRQRREAAIDGFIQGEHRIEVAKAAGRKSGVEARARLRAEADRKALRSQLGALEEALARNGQAVTALGQEIETFLRTMRDQTADLARRGIEAAASRQARRTAAARLSSNPTPF